MEKFFDRLNTWHEKYFRYVLLIFLCVLVGVALNFLPQVIMLFLPFLIAWCLSRVVGWASRLLTKYLHFPKTLAIVISVLFFAAIFILLLYFIVSAIISGIITISANISYLYNEAKDYILRAADTIIRIFDNLPDDVYSVVNNSLNELGTTLVKLASSLATRFAGGAITFAKNLPEIIIFVVVLMLSTYLFTKDSEKIHNFYLKLVKESTREKFTTIKKQLLSAGGGYIRAQLTIMSVTAFELFVGFLILRVPYAFLAAVLAALLDALPVLGTGTVLIPWSIISFILGDYFVGIGVLVLYLTCLFVRNLIEPRIVSHNIGLHPLVTIIAIYVGLKLFGFLGMILLPITVLCLVKLYHIGMFDWLFLNRKKEKEPDSIKEKTE